MKNSEIQKEMKQNNTKAEKLIGEIVETPIKEKDLNVCYEQIMLDSQVVLLRMRKVRRKKAGGIF